MKKNKTHTTRLQVSIVIPVFNEKKNILATLSEIKKHVTARHEILIVYDFDEDTTLSVLRKNKQANIRVIKNTIAKGPSGAIRTGIAQAKAPRVLVAMADLCDDFSQVNELLALVPQSAAIACPSRYMKGGEQRLKGNIKAWIPRIAGKLLRILAGIPTHDPTNSFKLYAKKLLDSLTLQSTVSFSVTLEIVVKAHARGYSIVEIPTIWRDRQHGKTHFKLGESLVAYFPWFVYGLLHRKKLH